MFATTIALVKTSTLLLYKRIFVTERFHLACHVMMAVTAGWFLTSLCVSALVTFLNGQISPKYQIGCNIFDPDNLPRLEGSNWPVRHQLLCIPTLHGCTQHDLGCNRSLHAFVCNTNLANVLGPQSTSVWAFPTRLFVSSTASIPLHTDPDLAFSSCTTAATVRVYYLGAMATALHPPYTESQRKNYFLLTPHKWQ